MTPNEFKAWFDGFTEAFEGRIPTKSQWERIKDRVAEIDGKSVTHTVYMDRYLPSYPYQPWYHRYSGGVCTTNTLGLSGAGSYSQALSANAAAQNMGGAFNSIQAMSDLGRAEAKALAA